jgi:hypothetical protein
MRPATYYYLAQAWSPGTRRHNQPGTPAGASRRGRHARPRRSHPGRRLPAVTRRVLAVLTGTSQTA